jgi:hypothetical protein
MTTEGRRISGGRAFSGSLTPGRGRTALDVAALPRMFLEATPHDIERFPEHDSQVFLRAVANHRDFVPSHLDVDPDPELVPALMMAVRDVRDHMARNKSGKQRVQLADALANLSFDHRIGPQAWK